MRIDYDQDHDTVYIRLHEAPRTVESDEIELGVIVDYGPEGQVVGVELMDAQRRGVLMLASSSLTSCSGAISRSWTSGGVDERELRAGARQQNDQRM